jgi:hypothetical protein
MQWLHVGQRLAQDQKRAIGVVINVLDCRGAFRFRKMYFDALLVVLDDMGAGRHEL